MQLNEALRKARKQKGYTLEDMARMLGYKSKVTYYYIESNKSKISLEVASKIGQILDRPIEELFSNFFKKKVQETQTNSDAFCATVPNSTALHFNLYLFKF